MCNAAIHKFQSVYILGVLPQFLALAMSPGTMTIFSLAGCYHTAPGNHLWTIEIHWPKLGGGCLHGEAIRKQYTGTPNKTIESSKIGGGFSLGTIQ